jgi:ATP-dependent DNA helicase RecQ
VGPTEPVILPDPLLEAAAPFGVTYLFPYQRLVITNVLDDSEDSIPRQIVVLPTGAGKTLCFQLPAAILPGITVVLYPLLSLMADQLRRAEAAGLGTAILKGGQPRGEREEIWRRIDSNEIRIILTNPETLAGEQVLDRLAAVEISHLVIDEAHCVSEWGETFRPSYLELGRVITTLAPRTTTAFTATASPPVLDAVRSHLFGEEGAHLIQAVPDRPNIAYSVLHTPAKAFALRTLLGGRGAPGSAGGVETLGPHQPEVSPPHSGTAEACGPASTASPTECQRREGPSPAGDLRLPALVFCRSRKRVETVARTLGDALGWDRVGAYHAGLSKEERTAIEQWFFHATDAVLVATCAYGMGVDKSNIRSTVHYDLPGSVEAFLQESGRAGRDGGPAESVVLFGREDIDHRGLIADPVRRQRYGQLLAYCGISSCRRVFLMGLLGSDCDACFGCDNCRGSTEERGVSQEEGARGAPSSSGVLDGASADLRAATASTVAFLRRNPRMLTTDQTARILRMVMEPGDRWAARRLPRPGTARIMDEWSHSEVIELIEGLVQDGALSRIGRGPWRGRLQATRHRPAAPVF